MLEASLHVNGAPAHADGQQRTPTQLQLQAEIALMQVKGAVGKSCRYL
jgi:hypothetical protein